ncbi:MAG TPA: LysR substrate-binding domain-containing protein [Gammaproteobacteria bacterium]|nr:LysR substrate-binding domain-containing protein [Gammaproteobacteria bacterium]
MTLRDLQYLRALAEYRHFGRAAEACFVSQPTLSTQIRKLEEELGVVLVERGPRQVMLTEAGKAVVERAEDVLTGADDIRRIARRLSDPASRTVRLGIFPTLGPYLLPHVLPEVRKRFPKLELLLVEEKTEEVLARLREGRLDAVIVALPVHEEGLHSEFLFEEPFLLATPAGHPLATHEAVTLDDLVDQSLLLLEDGHCLREQALEVCHLAGARERSGFRATSLETLRHMVAAGVGVTLLPVLATRPPIPAIDGLSLTPFRSHPPSRRIAMLWRESSALRGLLGELAGVFKSLPPDLLAPARPDTGGGSKRGRRAPRNSGSRSESGKHQLH